MDELREQAWDRQMAKDLAPGGPVQSLYDELKREMAEGKTLPMEEACRLNKRH